MIETIYVSNFVHTLNKWAGANGALHRAKYLSHAKVFLV